MRTLLLISTLLLQSVGFSQLDPIIIEKHSEYKEIEEERNVIHEIFIEELKKCFYEESNGQNLARIYVEYLNKTIEMWTIVEKYPEVIILEMNSIELMNLVKSEMQENEDLDKAIEDLLENIRQKTREHLEETAKDIRELTL